MTKEMDIVVRRNEENLKISKQMEMLIMGKNETIAPIAPINDDYETNTNAAITPTEIQRFYSGKNVFVTGGTGKLNIY